MIWPWHWRLGWCFGNLGWWFGRALTRKISKARTDTREQEQESHRAKNKRRRRSLLDAERLGACREKSGTVRVKHEGTAIKTNGLAKKHVE